MHRNRKSCNSSFIVNMASGMAHKRVRPTKNDNDAQHDGHPANTKSCSLGLQHISLILGIHMMLNWQLPYRDSLTSITWPYRGLKLAHQGRVFFWSWPLTEWWFSIGSRAHVRLTCWKQGRIVRNTVNANAGLKVNQIKTFSLMQMFLVALFCVYAWWLLKLKTEGQTIYRKPHRKVTKLKAKFYYFLG